MKKPFTRYVHEKLFNADVVLVCSEWKDFLGEAKKCLPPDKLKKVEEMAKERGDDEWCLATQFPFEGGGSIIWANPHAKIGTLVHEVTHAAHHLLNKRTVPLSSDTEEVYAYLIEFLFNGLLVQSKK